MRTPDVPSASLLESFLNGLPDDLRTPAVIDPTGRYRYAELLGAASERAARLTGYGVGPGDRVALVLPRGADAISYYLATLACGGTYVHLDPVDPPARQQSLLRAVSPAVVVAEPGAQPPPLIQGSVERPDPEDWERTGTLRAPATPDIAYVVLTSGSTGTPKPVQVGHSSVTNFLADVDRRAPVGGRVVSSWWTSPRFDVSVWEVWSALHRGGTVVAVPDDRRLDPNAFFDFLDEEKVSSAFVPAAFLETMASLAARARAISSLRRMLVGVEPIAHELLVAIARSHPELAVLNGYGPAEATICCTLYPVQRDASPDPGARTPIGTAITGNRLIVVDPDDNPVGDGNIGELIVVGAGVARGYLGGSVSGGFTHWSGSPAYRTGDLVKRLPDGNLVFVGRKDRQLKIHGYRLEPGEVESAIHAAARVRQVHVRAVASPRGPMLVAFLVSAPQTPLDEASLRRALAVRLPAYAVPARIVVLDSLPQTDAGKLDREALDRIAASLAHPAPPSEAPAVIPGSSGIAAEVAALWSRLLAADPAGGLSFVAAGGDSLTAMAFAAELRRITARDVSAAAVLAAAGPGDIAAAVQPLASGTERATGRTRGPLSPGQLGLWLHDQAIDRPSAYWESVCLRLPASADPARLAEAVKRAVRHQAVLSAYLDEGGASPELVLGGPPAPVSRYEDMPAAEAITAVRDRISTPGGPLAAFAVAEDRSGAVLAAAWHHLIVDDQALQAFLDTVTAWYADPAGEIPVPPRTFCDLAAELRSRDSTLEAEVAAEQIAAMLSDVLATTWPDGLPLPQPATGRLVLPPRRYGPLVASWRAAGVTEAAMWLGALSHQLAAAEGLIPVVGIPLSRRADPADAALGGYGLDTALLAPVTDPNRPVADAVYAAMTWLGHWLAPDGPSLLRVMSALRRAYKYAGSLPYAAFTLGAQPRLLLEGQPCQLLEQPVTEVNFPLAVTVHRGSSGDATVCVSSRRLGQDDLERLAAQMVRAAESGLPGGGR